MKLVDKILFESEEENLFKPRKIEDRKQKEKERKRKIIKDGLEKYGSEMFENIWVIQVIGDEAIYLIRRNDKEKAEEYFKTKFPKYKGRRSAVIPLLSYFNLFHFVIEHMNTFISNPFFNKKTSYLKLVGIEF